MPADEPATPKPKRRWFLPTPGKLLAFLLATEAILILFLTAMDAEGLGGLYCCCGCRLVFYCNASLVYRCPAFPLAVSIHRSVSPLLIVAVAVPCSWFTTEMKAAKEQREAVAAIQPSGFGVSPESGVGVRYEFAPTGELGLEGPPPEPGWLIRLVGMDFFHDVTLDVSFNKQTDEEASKNINGIPRLKGITFFSDNVGDDGLPRIAKFNAIQRICISPTRILKTETLCILKTCRNWNRSRLTA